MRTPGPWKLEHDPRWMFANIQRADGVKPDVGKGLSPEDAKFIVAACNAHHDFVAALDAIAHAATVGGISAGERKGLAMAAKIAKAALDKVQG